MGGKRDTMIDYLIGHEEVRGKVPHNITDGKIEEGYREKGYFVTKPNREGIRTIDNRICIKLANNQTNSKKER